MVPDGTPGYQHVQNLATCLVEQRGFGRVTLEAEAQLLALWEKLPEGDKGPVNYPPRYRDHLTKGRYKKAKSATHAPTDTTVGLESMKR